MSSFTQINENIQLTISEASMPKIVFIIPYRDREQQLHFFRRQMKHILEDMAETDYEMYYVHQADKRSFNCGALKNIGFLYVKNKYPHDYKNITLVFNDIDTMPFSKNFLYYQTKPGVAKHFYGFNYTLGGIVSITGGDFERVNGFPNFWAWGYEDNMLNQRVKSHRISIDRTQFYPYGDKNILHFLDGTTKYVNKDEHQRYSLNTMEGWNSIKNLQYEYDYKTQFINVSHFDTGITENKNASFTHDLRTGTTPFQGLRSGRGNTMTMTL
jgi:hypothetical protein